MGSPRKPLEGRSEAHVGFRPRPMRSLAATLRNPFLLDFRGGFLKKKRAQGPLSPCDPGQGRNTLQPIAAVGGVFDDGVRLHERNQDAIAARLQKARGKEDRVRLGANGDHAARNKERHRHQEQVKRRAGKRRRGTRRATAEAGTRRDRRERSTQFAKYCEIIDSHNFASCFTPLERSEAR